MNHVPIIDRTVLTMLLLPALVGTGCADDPEKHLATFSLETSPSQIEVVVGEEEESPVQLTSKAGAAEGPSHAYLIGDLLFASSNPAVATLRGEKDGGGLIHEAGHFAGYYHPGFTCPEGHLCYEATTEDRGRLIVKCHQAGSATISISGTLHAYEVEKQGNAKHTVPAATAFEVTCVVKTGLGPACDDDRSEPVNVLGEGLLGEASWCDAIDLDVDDGLTVHSSDEVAPKAGAGNHTEFWGRLAKGVTLTQADLDAGAGELLACGEHEHGRTLCANPQISVLPGDWIVLAHAFHDRLPDSCNDHLVYGFAIEGDGNPANDYVADPAFPNDWYQATDHWYEAVCDPFAGWNMTARQVTNGTPEPLDDSAARIVITVNLSTLIMPASELSSPSGYRGTAMRHTGQWGFDGDWDGDVERPVTAPTLGVPINF